jgi:hypothetical protein
MPFYQPQINQNAQTTAICFSPAYILNPLLARSKIACLSPVRKFQFEEVTQVQHAPLKQWSIMVWINCNRYYSKIRITEKLLFDTQHTLVHLNGSRTCHEKFQNVNLTLVSIIGDFQIILIH